MYMKVNVRKLRYKYLEHGPERTAFLIILWMSTVDCFESSYYLRFCNFAINA